MDSQYHAGVGGSRKVRGHEPVAAFLLAAVFGYLLVWALVDLADRVAIRTIGERVPAVVDDVRRSSRSFREITFTYAVDDVELTETDEFSALGWGAREGERIHVHYIDQSDQPARVAHVAPLVSDAMVGVFSAWMLGATLTAAGLRAGDRVRGEHEVRPRLGGTITRPGRRASTAVLVLCILVVAWRLLRLAG